MKRLTLALFLLATAVGTTVLADERTEPIDVIIALDKSLSMVEEIGAVKEYVDTQVIDELLIPGDFFLVVAFYGQTQVPVAMEIRGQADKERAKAAIDALLADGRFTDIGNALDVLGQALAKYSRPQKEKYLLLITDGIQEAPPDSKYYSPDGTFNHAFLENTKTIQKLGWKIVVLGVGTHQQAQQLAADLSASYQQLSETPTAEELAGKTQDFLSRLKAGPAVSLGPVDLQGRGRLRVPVTSEGYTEEKTLRLQGIRLTLPGLGSQEILPQPVSWSVPPGATRELRTAVLLPSVPASGQHSGTLEFQFAGQERFLPVVMPVEFRVLSVVGSYWLWLLAGVVVLALLIVLVVLLVGRSRKARYRFRLIIEGDGQAASKEVHRIVEGRPLYLEESAGTVQISPARSPQSLARLVAAQKGVRLNVLKAEKFPKLQLRELPLSILDFDFRLRLEGKKDVTVRLASAG